MENQQLEYFCMVAREGSITKAAELLKVSQPSLSQTISKLEKHLGVRLFERVPKGILLTDPGQRLFTYATERLAGERDICRELKDTEGRPSGDIFVRVQVVSAVIAQLFCGFKHLYPNVSIHFLKEELNNRYNMETPDMSITTNVNMNEGMRSVELVTEDLVAAMSVGHRLAHRARIRLEELAEEDFLNFCNNEMQALTDGFCAISGFQPKVLLECSTSGVMLNLLSSNMGITIVPTSWRKMCGDRIALVPIEYPVCRRTVRLVWDTSRYMSNASRLFKDYIIENFAKELAANF